MDAGTNLIFLIIFGIIGFIISKIWDINPYRIFSDLLAGIFVISLMLLLLPVILNPSSSLDYIPLVINLFVNNLPGMVIGDIAGSIIASITGEKS